MFLLFSSFLLFACTAANEQLPEMDIGALLANSGGPGADDGPSSALELGDFEGGDFLPLILSTADETTVKFKIPRDILGEPFIVHAVVDKGPAPNGEVPNQLERGSPLVHDGNVFHFELSEVGDNIYLIQHQYNSRSSDPEIEYAFDNGLWYGHRAALPIIRSNPFELAELEGFNETDSFGEDQDFESRRLNNLRSVNPQEPQEPQAPEEEEEDFFIVDAASLISSGFYCAPSLGLTFTIKKEATNVFPRNTNLEVHVDAGEAILPIFFSIMKLPERQLQKRVMDDRVGYFGQDYIDYGMHEDTSKKPEDAVDRTVSIIERRRLEKDSKGVAIKPITYYIDESVPESWRSTFKEAVEAWLPAFEAAGFKNAIRAVLPGDRDWPEDYHIGDLRYDSISVMMSSVVYAMGPSVNDPRSGEILHSDIIFGYNWYKTVIGKVEELLQRPSGSSDELKSIADQLRVNREHAHQCSMAGSTAQMIDNAFAHLTAKAKYGYIPKELVHEALKYVVMHEVGHTLGLRHNFIASATRTIDQLQNPQEGIASSVMDYLPANVWSLLNEDAAKPGQGVYATTIGEYDIAAIKYGYTEDTSQFDAHSDFDAASPSGTFDDPKLRAIAASAGVLASDEDRVLHQNPYVQYFDLSNDPISYYLNLYDLLVKNSQQSIPVAKGESWTKKWSQRRFLLGYTVRIAKELGRFIGGVSVEKNHCDGKSTGPNVRFVSHQEHERVVKFLTKVVAGNVAIFPSPDEYSSFVEVQGCRPNEIHGCYGIQLANVDSVLNTIRGRALDELLDATSLQKLVDHGSNAQYTVEAILVKTFDAVWNDPLNVNNFNIQTEFTRGVEAIARSAEDARLQMEVQAAYDQCVAKAQQLMDSTESAASKAHFKKLTEPAPEKNDNGGGMGLLGLLFGMHEEL